MSSTILDDLAKAASKFLHFERVWRLTEDPDAAGIMVFWRNELSQLLTDYERIN